MNNTILMLFGLAFWATLSAWIIYHHVYWPLPFTLAGVLFEVLQLTALALKVARL